MPSTNSAIGAAWRRLFAATGADTATPAAKRITRQDPTSDTWVAQHATWRPAGYYRLFCAHDRPLWQTCASATCRRSAREAAVNLAKLIDGKLL